MLHDQTTQAELSALCKLTHTPAMLWRGTDSTEAAVRGHCSGLGQAIVHQMERGGQPGEGSVHRGPTPLLWHPHQHGYSRTHMWETGTCAAPNHETLDFYHSL